MIIIKGCGIFQFQVCYMKYPMLKNVGHIEKRLSRCFNINIFCNIEIHQIYVNKKYVLVISLIMFYDNSTADVYKVIGCFIYSFIYNLLLLII